ncbi:MAG: ECF transporter S component [Prevotellaceae bacterium]|nr:ECF transporter S component [Prevotellaceae bacterium]
METSAKLHSLSYRDAKTYLFAGIFIVGNILLPQLCHLIPQGGLIWLPIYFFTLIAAYKFGLQTGLLTAILSPLVNCLLFGMPPLASLPAILIKSSLLAIGAAYAAKLFGKVAILPILLVVLLYQIVGILAEWMILKEFFPATQDFRIGIPGLLLQVFGGYLVLKAISKL